MRKCVRLYLFVGKGYVSNAAGLRRGVAASASGHAFVVGRTYTQTLEPTERTKIMSDAVGEHDLGHGFSRKQTYAPV